MKTDNLLGVIMSYLTVQQTLSESSILSRVNILVRKIISNDITIQAIINELNIIYLPFIQFFDNDEFNYSKTIMCFFQTTNYVMGIYPRNIIWNGEKTQELIHCMNQYKREIYFDDVTYQLQKLSEQEELKNYLTQLTTHYQRLLFVRVDLGYFENKQNQITIGDFSDHIDTLDELIANEQGLFQYLQGYAWALEQGESKGYHCHLLLIYDGARRQKGMGTSKTSW